MAGCMIEVRRRLPRTPVLPCGAQSCSVPVGRRMGQRCHSQIFRTQTMAQSSCSCPRIFLRDGFSRAL
eukprot:2534554-Pyramimonas_sp.AAC.1